jgi:hypothetical protein
MRISRAYVGLVLAAGVLLAACSGDEAAVEEETSSPSPSVSEPSSLPSPSVVETEPVESVREVSFSPVDPGMLGMHVAGAQEGDWPSGRVPVESFRLWDTGTSWLQIEATRGRYDWRGLDTALSTAADAGVSDVLMILGPTPVWNASTTRGVQYPVPGAASVPRSFAAWDEFVSAVVDRYAGQITAYQIWNEASLKMFWRGSPERMANLTQRAYQIIKEKDPEALVVAASTTIRLSGAYNRFFPAYLEALAERDWPVDVLAIHSYPSGEDDPLQRSRNLRQVRQTLGELDAHSLPVWDTELNYGLAGPGDIPRTEVVGDQATSWVVRTYLDSLRFGIDRTYWYIWTPEPYDLLGLQMTNGSAGAAGLRTVSSWVAGGEWGGCSVSGLVNSCLVRKDGVVSEVLWSDFLGGTVAGFAAGAEVCDFRNECSALDGPSVAVTSDPVRVTPAREFVEVD